MKSLCTSCISSVVIQGDSEAVYVHCNELYEMLWVPQPVLKCSKYRDKNFEHRDKLEEIAFILNPNKRTIGFMGTSFVAPGTDEHKKLTGNS